MARFAEMKLPIMVTIKLGASESPDGRAAGEICSEMQGPMGQTVGSSSL